MQKAMVWEENNEVFFLPSHIAFEIPMECSRREVQEVEGGGQNLAEVWNLHPPD